MKKFHDKHLNRKTLSPGQKVWVYNSRLKLFPGKLKSKWDGPMVVIESYYNGVVLIENEKNKTQFKVNGHRLNDVTRQMPGSSARVTTQGSSLTNNYDARKCNDANFRNNEKHRKRQLT